MTQQNIQLMACLITLGTAFFASNMIDLPSVLSSFLSKLKSKLKRSHIPRHLSFHAYTITRNLLGISTERLF